jgi:hypothetical protein
MNANSYFPVTSRYYANELATFQAADGQQVAYLRRRFIPLPNRYVKVASHVVAEGERLDQITARVLGDPEQFWRIADPNGAMRPEELTEVVGTRIAITLPEGIFG